MHTFNGLRGHGPEHIIPHDQLKVGHTFLNSLRHFNDMTEEQLVNAPTWST